MRLVKNIAWKGLLILSLWVGSFACVCCTNNEMPAWSKFRDVDRTGWQPEQELTFEVGRDSLPDASKNYEAALVVRHSARRHLRSLPLVVEYSDSTGILSLDTISISLMAEDGSTLGKTAYGVTQLEIPLAHELTITPGYTITIHPLCRNKNPEGVLNIGVLLRE